MKDARSARPSLAISQEMVVLAISVGLFIVFSLVADGFFTASNILTLLRNVSILGILGIAMCIVVVGRGIDLSIVAIYAASSAWAFHMVSTGTPLVTALSLGLGLALVTALITGFLVAYVEIPAIFSTLAMGTLLYGFARLFLLDLDIVYLSEGANPILFLGSGRVLGVPLPVILFLALALAAHLFLRFTRAGRFIYAIGDNPLTARITGIPVRPVIVLQYVISAIIAFGAGILMAASVESVNTRVAISTMVYDIILIVVIGGIGLSGGKGGVRNVIVGTLLIGILLNGMTILNIEYTLQNIIKSVLLLTAVLVDSLLNPRDEQTSQQGDI